jgi:hypothetical protein
MHRSAGGRQGHAGQQNKEHVSMFKKSLLAIAAGGAIAFAALTGTSGAAQAHSSVHIGIGLPGVHVAPGYAYRERCWLPERHLCGRPVYGRPVYGGPVYYPPVYGGPVYYAPPPVYYGRYRRW